MLACARNLGEGRVGAVGELRELSADEDALWRALGRVSHLMPRVLDEEMTRATGLSMTEYAVLLMLAEAP